METEKYNKNSDPSLGYYPDPGWEWQKPEPKTYLVNHDLAKYAKAWILNLVELVHWLAYVLSFILSFIIFQHASALRSLLGTDIQVFLLVVSPLISLYGGLAAITMHEYEGWQIVYFENPLHTDFDIKKFNNEWLREVAYKLLFFWNGLGLLAFSLGVFGINKITLTLAIISVIISFIGPQNPKVTFYFNKQPVFPLSLSILVVFIINAIINFIAYFYLFGEALSAASFPIFLAGLAPILLMFGGILEGIIAESTFNQWWHFIAVVFINAGIIAQIYFFSLLW